MKRPSSRIIAAWRAGLQTRSISENADWRRNASLTSSAQSSVSCWRAGSASLPMMRAMRSSCACSSSSVRKRRRSASHRPLPCAAHHGANSRASSAYDCSGWIAGIEARLRALDVERPEGLDVALGVARHRLGEVARRRADRAHHRHRAGAARQRLDQRGALVEVGEPARQVGRIAAFAGQLAEAARHLAQRLGPAAGRVGHQRDVQALVAEVLGDRDRAIDARLACRHRHVRGVGDDHRALHQRPAGARIGRAAETRRARRPSRCRARRSRGRR